MTRSLFALACSMALLLALGPAVADDAATAADVATDAAAGAEHAMPAPPSHPLFDQFKSLVGTWEGTVTHGSADPAPATVTYKLTAGGTALVETIFVGTPMEMVSVYFLDGDTLKMTHYCIAQNQPTMTASPGNHPNTIVLNFDSATNMPDPGAMHMHEATFEFLGPDHHRSTWQGYVGGAPVDEMRAALDLHRQP